MKPIDGHRLIKNLRKYRHENISVDGLELLIEQMPSVQPEIIRCKDCRYYGESLPDVDTRMICHKTALNYKPDDFCSYAERREDG